MLIPRVLLLALDLASPATEALLAEIHRACTRTRVLVAGAAGVNGMLPRLLGAGAEHALPDEPAEALAAALRGGGRPDLGEPTGAPGERPVHLTGHQREVVAPLASGCSNAQIAAELRLSERTARHQLAGPHPSLGLATRGEVIAWAARQGLDLEGPPWP